MTVSPSSLELKNEVARRERRVKRYLLEERPMDIDHPHLRDAVYSYLKAGGKSLRPAVLLFACGAVGGDEDDALPMAAAIELYHTFTLVHDDVIDNDDMRRGVPTVHVDFARRSQQEMGLSDKLARHYGITLAILAGDIQQGWSASLVSELYRSRGISAELALELVHEMFRRVQGELVNGETMDVILSQMPIDRVETPAILKMLWQKTGILYEFAGRAGAAIGLNTPDLKDDMVESIASFTGQCGIAFQLQDDILGVTGDPDKLGKPVGSDIREGKRTVVLMNALPNMTETQRAFTLKTLGNADADDSDVQEVAGLLESCKGIAQTRQLALTYIEDALTQLSIVPDSEYKALLTAWADYIVNRDK